MEKQYVLTTEDGVPKYNGDPYVFLNTSSKTYGEGLIMPGMERVATLKFDSIENAAVACAALLINS